MILYQTWKRLDATNEPEINQVPLRSVYMAECPTKIETAFSDGIRIIGVVAHLFDAYETIRIAIESKVVVGDGPT